MKKNSGDLPPLQGERRSKARRKGLELREPCLTPVRGCPDRDKWIEEVCRGFVNPSKANQGHYRALLEVFWPKNPGIPGPIVFESEMRAAIERRLGKRYNDPFRRARELQGEEGLTGIARQGKKWQLISLELSPKRKPRIGLGDTEWKTVLATYNGCCANCGRKEARGSLAARPQNPQTPRRVF